MSAHIYADNAASTKLDKVAFDAMTPWLLESYGNASQPYAFARGPKKALTESRSVSITTIFRSENIFLQSRRSSSKPLSIEFASRVKVRFSLGSSVSSYIRDCKLPNVSSNAMYTT